MIKGKSKKFTSTKYIIFGRDSDPNVRCLCTLNLYTFGATHVNLETELFKKKRIRLQLSAFYFKIQLRIRCFAWITNIRCILLSSGTEENF